MPSAFGEILASFKYSCSISIADLEEYSEYIDKQVHSLFIKNDELNMVLRVGTVGPIKAIDLSGLIYNMTQLAMDFSEQHNLGLEVDDIDIQLILQSPGDMKWSSKNIRTLGIMTLLIAFLAGADVNFGWGLIDLKTPGLIKRVEEFFDSSAENKRKGEQLQQEIQNMNIAPPLEATQVIDSLSTEDSNQ